MRTRRELLVAGATGALLAPAGAGALLAPATADASPEPVLSEPERLQRLVELELLLLYCYEHVLASPVLGPRAHRTLEPFVAHEQAHIRVLERRLVANGGTVPPGPASVHAANSDLAHHKIGGRLGQLRGDPDAVRLLLALEQVMMGEYSLGLTQLNDTDLIELMAQIMANEAQHDAMLGLLLPPGKLGSAVPYALVGGLQ